MIVIYPEGYVRDLLHEADRKENPERHWLMKDSYLREEMMDMCPTCAIHYKWNSKLHYDARTNCYYKIANSNAMMKGKK